MKAQRAIGQDAKHVRAAPRCHAHARSKNRFGRASATKSARTQEERQFPDQESAKKTRARAGTHFTAARRCGRRASGGPATRGANGDKAGLKRSVQDTRLRRRLAPVHLNHVRAGAGGRLGGVYASKEERGAVAPGRGDNGSNARSRTNRRTAIEPRLLESRPSTKTQKKGGDP